MAVAGVTIMVDAYFRPILYAFIAFPLAAALFTLPFLVYQYRRYGYIHVVRAITLYTCLLYLMNAYFLVILPFPSTRHNAALAGGDMQLVPFQFVSDFLKETSVSLEHPATYLHIFRERAFWQVIFNILLTVPFGMLLRYYFHRGWLGAMCWSFLLSLSFEVTQLTGIYGIYDHAYRIFDVDDLICNTFGGMIGFLIAAWISEHLPNVRQLDARVDRSKRRVTYTRRGLAFLIDNLLCSILLSILSALDIPLSFWIATGAYFMLLTYATNGITPGKWIVRIQLVSDIEHKPDNQQRIPLYSLMIRYGLLYWGFFGLQRLLNLPFSQGYPSRLEAIVYLLILFVLNVGFFLHLVTRLFHKGSLMFYEQWSHTSHRIMWPTAGRIEASHSDTREAWDASNVSAIDASSSDDEQYAQSNDTTQSTDDDSSKVDKSSK